MFLVASVLHVEVQYLAIYFTVNSFSQNIKTICVLCLAVPIKTAVVFALRMEIQLSSLRKNLKSTGHRSPVWYCYL